MPKIGSNRVQYQTRQTRRDNLMSGMGSRYTARLEAEEKTIKRKVEKLSKNSR